MSAIFGIVSKKRKWERSQADAMRHALRHRATNGSGDWYDDGVYLAHLHHVHTPEERYDRQPLQLQEHIIISDSRLDNRGELARQLGIHDSDLPQVPDSRLIALAFLRWGEDCLSKLEGEFSFAIWNETKQELFIAIDPMGFRPLFYFDSGDHFIFATEMKGVLAAKPRPHSFNEKALLKYLFRNNEPYETHVLGLMPLYGGHLVRCSAQGMQMAGYWQLQDTGKYRFNTNEAWIECLREILAAEIRNGIRTDRDIGISLSGGLDSGSLASLLARELQKQNRPLYTFSSVLPDDHPAKQRDESRYVKLLAERFPNIVPSLLDMKDIPLFEGFAAAGELDEQIPNPFFYADIAILDAAREKNVGAFYNGFGGDYWISNRGFDTVSHMFRKGEWKEAMRHVRMFAEQERKNSGRIFLRESLPWLYSFVRNRNAPFRPNEFKSMIQPGVYSRHAAEIRQLPRNNSLVSLNKRYYENGHISNHLALFANRHAAYGMSTGIPFFSKNVYEFLAHAPESLHVHRGIRRSLLRHAMDDVTPPEILWRNDKGQYVPGFVFQAYDQLPGLLQRAFDADPVVFDRWMDKQALILKAERFQRHAKPGKVNIQLLLALSFLQWIGDRYAVGELDP